MGYMHSCKSADTAHTSRPTACCLECVLNIHIIPWFKFIHVNLHQGLWSCNVCETRTLPSAGGAPWAPSLLPRRTNAIFICLRLQLLKVPAGTPGYFSPPFELLSTLPFTARSESRRSVCSVYSTMWRTCGLFCAWTLLFMTEVCAQSQRRYTFIYFFFLI